MGEHHRPEKAPAASDDRGDQERDRLDNAYGREKGSDRGGGRVETVDEPEGDERLDHKPASEGVEREETGQTA